MTSSVRIFKVGDTVLTKTDEGPLLMDFPFYCVLQALVNVHLLFHLQYILSWRLFFCSLQAYVTHLHTKNASSHFADPEGMCLLPILLQSRISCSFCLSLHYLFSLLTAQRSYFCSLTLVKHYLSSAFDLVLLPLNFHEF